MPIFTNNILPSRWIKDKIGIDSYDDFKLFTRDQVEVKDTAPLVENDRYFFTSMNILGRTAVWI